MTKQYDTQEQIDAFNIYVKQNPAGRQVHHTGTLGYDDDEWKAFQEGWNAALAQPDKESLDLFEYWNAVEGWVKIDEVRKHFGSVGCGTIYKTAGEDRVPVYTGPPRAVKTYHEGKPVYVALRPRTFDDYGNKIV